MKTEMRQAQPYEEIAPLIELCKSGRLFEVQNWIAEGRPINPPVLVDNKRRRKSPLQVAIDKGFHSMVQVLLEGGAVLQEGPYSALSHALEQRRFDLVQLLVEHGSDIHAVGMESAFDTWSPDIIEFFIDHGVDLEHGNPLAYALCSRIRPALGIFKRYEHRFPGLRKQINIALRYHCKAGNLKWVSLMLWAGADPYERGPYYPDDDDKDDCMSALELAAFYEQFDVFKLKSIHLDPNHPGVSDLLWNACFSEKSDLLKMLLKKGFRPGDLEDKGTSLIQSLISSMSNTFDFYRFSRQDKDIDTYRSREKMKMLHMLARVGALWLPDSRGDINNARRSLLKMRSDYVMEFIWIMSEYRACTRETIEALMKTPTIRSLISKHTTKFNDFMESFRDHSSIKSKR